MKKTIIYLLIILPLLTNAQKKLDSINHNISVINYLTIESDDLNTEFLNMMLFGGFITDEMKDNWIDNGDDNNRLNAELTNKIEYKFSSNQLTSYYFQFADINLINSAFKDDLLKLVLHGNYNYQDETLDFSNTIIRADRYQQYKFGYNYHIYQKENVFQINTAISYLRGNHHAQFNINRGTLHTSNLGTDLDLDYNIKSMITDTSRFSIFNGNGNGVAIDFSIHFNKGLKESYEVKIRDLGYISWNNNSIISNTDSSFNFTGIELEDLNNIQQFNDSVMDISFNNTKTKFRSFIPARITLSYSRNLEHKYFQTLLIASHSRWQPYEVKGGVNWDLFTRGFSESGYNTSLDIMTNIDLTYLYSTIGFSVGGFTDETNIHFALSDKKHFFTIGTYHLNKLFNDDKTSISGYIILSRKF